MYIAEHAYKYNNYANVFMQTVHVIRLESIMQLPIMLLINTQAYYAQQKKSSLVICSKYSNITVATH